MRGGFQQEINAWGQVLIKHVLAMLNYLKYLSTFQVFFCFVFVFLSLVFFRSLTYAYFLKRKRKSCLLSMKPTSWETLEHGS